MISSKACNACSPTSVKSLKTDNPLAGAFTLAGLSFLYGILHAVGPGHGKTIISSYVVANEETVRRGILISFIASALQAFTAVALVGVLLIGLRATGLQVNAWSSQLESVSYALIALVGLYLLWTQIVRLWRRRFGDDQAAEAGHGHGEHGHDHHHTTTTTTITTIIITTRTARPATISSMRGSWRVQCRGAR